PTMLRLFSGLLLLGSLVSTGCTFCASPYDNCSPLVDAGPMVGGGCSECGTGSCGSGGCSTGSCGMECTNARLNSAVTGYVGDYAGDEVIYFEGELPEGVPVEAVPEGVEPRPAPPQTQPSGPDVNPPLPNPYYEGQPMTRRPNSRTMPVMRR